MNNVIEAMARAICDVAATGQGNWPVYRKDAKAALTALIKADWPDDVGMAGNKVMDDFAQPDEPTTRTVLTEAMGKAMLKQILESDK